MSAWSDEYGTLNACDLDDDFDDWDFTDPEDDELRRLIRHKRRQREEKACMISILVGVLAFFCLLPVLRRIIKNA